MTQALGELARLARLQREHELAHSFLKESFELATQMDSKRAAAPVLQQLAYWPTRKASVIARPGC
jgi:hypothetical protein